jgi:hypothetical protein
MQYNFRARKAVLRPRLFPDLLPLFVSFLSLAERVMRQLYLSNSYLELAFSTFRASQDVDRTGNQ